MNKYISMGEPYLGCDLNDDFIDEYTKQLSFTMKNETFSANKLISEFERKFMKIFDENNFSLINNATTALELALYIIKHECGYVNIVTQAIGFFGVHSMIISRDYPLTLCDVQTSSFGFETSDLEMKLLNGANVILVTHMNGIPANIQAISDIADKVSVKMGKKIWIIDDLSRSLGAKVEGKNLSFFSDFTIFSFQAKKHFTLLGEGGGIVCKKKKHAEVIKSARGFGDKKFFGFNHKISFSQVLFGLKLIDEVQDQIEKRISIGRHRDKVLSDMNLFEFMYPRDFNFTCTYYLYTLKINDNYPSAVRDKVIKLLNKKGIGNCIANLPVYKTSTFINNNLNQPVCSNANYLGDRILSVSLHPSFTNLEEDYIINALSETAYEFN
ncbi:DegT/DnrJ/EryC1/StrS family aminotransferase [Xenorhabdus sp. Vera]|uniref:DegT/DnrJ/EryC1/StrS family aminotransferase n=1 Tax=Xenorhabdus koppenhoeferi TaxID=351659 RepID=UPI0019C9EBDB|nr:DegT/DnrJ/EryC1/StrS family aminotransferase [Xenorhabdus sp. Vera]MBD2809864.1 DegT/DnrJ/EryC1/StrS family aminotransferase [Xenorhabdus sp. Vera]